MNRRNFCALTGGAVASLATNIGCRSIWGRLPNDGRFSVRPTGKSSASSPPLGSATVGRQIDLGLSRDRDAILQLPDSATDAPLPLLVFLHGATQSAEDMFWYLDSAPDETGVSLLLSEFPGQLTRDSFGKMLGPGESLTEVDLGRGKAYYIGGRHVFYFFEGPGRTDESRLAANTLIWQRQQVLIRMEGGFSKDQAAAIAHSLR